MRAVVHVCDMCSINEVRIVVQTEEEQRYLERVFARVNFEHQLRMVGVWKEYGEALMKDGALLAHDENFTKSQFEKLADRLEIPEGGAVLCGVE